MRYALFLAVLGVVVSCGGSRQAQPPVGDGPPRDGTTSRGTPGPPARVTGLERSPAQLGCAYASADGTLLACIHRIKVRGETLGVVRIRKADASAAGGVQFEIYDSDGVNEAGVEQANSYLRGYVFHRRGKRSSAGAVRDGWRESGRRVTLELAGHTLELELPRIRPAKRQRCCRWRPTAAHRFSGPDIVAVSLDLVCRFTTASADAADECYEPGYDAQGAPLESTSVVASY